MMPFQSNDRSRNPENVVMERHVYKIRKFLSEIKTMNIAPHSLSMMIFREARKTLTSKWISSIAMHKTDPEVEEGKQIWATDGSTKLQASEPNEHKNLTSAVTGPKEIHFCTT